MAGFNFGNLLTAVNNFRSHPAGKTGEGGTLALLVLSAVSAAGIAIPMSAWVVGPIAGALLYNLLPEKIQKAIGNAEKQVTDSISQLPTQAVDEFPNGPKPPLSQGPENGNFNKSG